MCHFVGCSINISSIYSLSDAPPPEPEPPSLVDEGLRIARQYGLGEFESELEDLKKASATAVTTTESMEMADQDTDRLDSARNDDVGIVEVAAAVANHDQEPMTT